MSRRRRGAIDVDVTRSGGSDREGNPKPATTHVLERCMLAPRATSDPLDASDVTSTTSVLYAAPGADIRSTDTVNTPATSWCPAGKWQVDGDPGFWPLGTEIPLRRI